MRLASVGLVGGVLLGISGCGGDSPATGGSNPPLCTVTTAATVVINSTGVSPKTACVSPGGSVTFSNADTVAHDIAADNATTCPLLNVGSIVAGGARTVNFPAATVCGYHDAGAASNAAFQGTVAVATPGSGAGY